MVARLLFQLLILGRVREVLEDFQAEIEWVKTRGKPEEQK